MSLLDTLVKNYNPSLRADILSEAPHYTSDLSVSNKKTKTEMANLVLLFHELMSHEVNV